MAKAQVTIKVTPNELQVINEALKMYVHALRRLERKDAYKHPLEGYQFNLSIIKDGDVRQGVMMANAIRNDLGLK